MVGHFERNGEGNYDFIAKADGQTVHTRTAAFFATGGIPARASERVALGCHIGFGLVIGGTGAVGCVSLASKIIMSALAFLS